MLYIFCPRIDIIFKKIGRVVPIALFLIIPHLLLLRTMIKFIQCKDISTDGYGFVGAEF